MIDPQISLIERLMERHPDAVNRHDLNPTRTLDAEAIYRGKLVPLCVSVWCNGTATDYHVGAVRNQGPEADEQVYARYVYDGSQGVWTHDVYLDGLLGTDPAWQGEEKQHAPLEPHDLSELGMLLATARVIQAPVAVK